MFPLVDCFSDCSVQRAMLLASRAGRCDSTLVGDEVGLETALQQQLYEPLLHIVRNAVSHGIESESQRVASGKVAEWYGDA